MKNVTKIKSVIVIYMFFCLLPSFGLAIFGYYLHQNINDRISHYHPSVIGASLDNNDIGYIDKEMADCVIK